MPFTAPGNLTRVYAVASGKGGVGKSSITVNLAAAMAADGLSVGVLDADIYGFSVPRMLGVTQSPTKLDDMILPPVAHDVKVISIGMFVPGNQPVVWRGPMLHRALEQFLTDVHWGDLDVLLLDLPPGTGDIAISCAQLLPGAEILVVTTPQTAAAEVAERAGSIAVQTKQQIVGSDREHVVAGRSPTAPGSRCSARAAARSSPTTSSRTIGAPVPLLGQVPIDVALREGGDDGTPVVPAGPGQRGRRRPARHRPEAGPTRPRARRPPARADPGRSLTRPRSRWSSARSELRSRRGLRWRRGRTGGGVPGSTVPLRQAGRPGAAAPSGRRAGGSGSTLPGGLHAERVVGVDDVGQRLADDPARVVLTRVEPAQLVEVEVVAQLGLGLLGDPDRHPSQLADQPGQLLGILRQPFRTEHDGRHGKQHDDFTATHRPTLTGLGAGVVEGWPAGPSDPVERPSTALGGAGDASPAQCNRAMRRAPAAPGWPQGRPAPSVTGHTFAATTAAAMQPAAPSNETAAVRPCRRQRRGARPGPVDQGAEGGRAPPGASRRDASPRDGRC